MFMDFNDSIYHATSITKAGHKLSVEIPDAQGLSIKNTYLRVNTTGELRAARLIFVRVTASFVFGVYAFAHNLLMRYSLL